MREFSSLLAGWHRQCHRGWRSDMPPVPQAASAIKTLLTACAQYAEQHAQKLPLHVLACNTAHPHL